MKKEFEFCPYCSSRMTTMKEGDRRRRRCEDCSFIQYMNPAPAAGVLLLDDSGRVLLVKRRFDPFAGLWVIPSGYIEYDEDIARTAVRELQEEAGIIVELDGVHAVESCFDDPRGNTVLVVYDGHITGGTLKAGDDAEEAGFFAMDKLPPIAFDCQKKILGRLAGRRID